MCINKANILYIYTRFNIYIIYILYIYIYIYIYIYTMYIGYIQLIITHFMGGGGQNILSRAKLAPSPHIFEWGGGGGSDTSRRTVPMGDDQKDELRVKGYILNAK